MSLVLHSRIPLWSNDGTAAITGLTFGGARWLVPGGTSVTASPDATTWVKVNPHGADALAIQYTAKVVNVGGATAYSGGNWAIPAVGMLYDYNDADLVPHFVQGSPAGYVSSSTLARGFQFWWMDESHNHTSGLAASDLASTSISSMFPNTAAPADNDRTGNTLWLIRKPFRTHGSATAFNSVAAFSQVPWEHGISGCAAIWLAVSMFQNQTTGTPADMRLKAQMDVLLFHDVATIDPRDDKHSHLPGRAFGVA